MNPVVHFELPFENGPRAIAFYEAAFGWKMQSLGPEMGDYILATTIEEGAPTSGGPPQGGINGGLFPKDPTMPAQVPSVVIGVDNIEAAMAMVTAAGGEVLGQPMPIPDIGLYVSFFDTEGNRVSMLEPQMAVAPT